MQILKVAGLIFECEDDIEVSRAQTLLTKEPGTIAWLDTLETDDVLYDVGANIGCYTLYAAKRGATVYAFEPHIVNARSLLRNIVVNDLHDSVTVLTCALDEQNGPLPFHYKSLRPGASGSQLGHTTGEDGGEFAPMLTEIKVASRLNALGLPPATHVKIDVDGNELAILRGMLGLKPREIQVEVHPKDREVIGAWMALHGLELVKRHYTANGQRQLDKGKNADEIVHNAIYRRTA